MKYKKWTKEEDAILYEKFSDTPTNDLLKVLDRTFFSISSRASILGIKKSDALLESNAITRNAMFKNVSAGRFKKGHKTFNKGVKMSPELKEKIEHTFFKKGHIPHNTKYDGHEKLTNEGYIMIRVRQGKYELKHRVLWEQKHGKIPEGYILTFRDGNKQNLDLDNLELITVKENMIRNSFQRFPEELKDTINLLKKIKKKVNEK